MIADVLRQAGVEPADLEGIVVADGPGSFTGLRIGWAAALGLAQERDLPLRAVPALLAAAAGAAARVGPEPVAACFDALRGQVFGAVYRIGPDRIETLVGPAVLTVAELVQRAPVRPRVAVGDGAVRFAEEMLAWTGAAPLGLHDVTPGAQSLLTLVGRDGVGRRLDAGAEPVYGRPAEAQAKWEARHGRPLPDPTGHAG
jgi:tRNA threonylcarbamoyladenosine biosynthesis protein TsaB